MLLYIYTSQRFIPKDDRDLYICSGLFENLRNFEIALRILSIAKLRVNFEIA